MQAEIERVGLGKDATYAVRYLCPWCGENSRIAASDGVPFPPNEVAFVVICEAMDCRRPSLVLGHIVYDSIADVRRIFATEVHPPVQPLYRGKGVPADIERDFQEALACQGSGHNYAAALVARRVLQAATRDVIGGAGQNLATEINTIPAGRISDVLRNAAHQVRLVGNDAAHANSISSDDVDHLIVFTEQLLDALYVQPAVLAEALAKRPQPTARTTTPETKAATSKKTK